MTAPAAAIAGTGFMGPAHAEGLRRARLGFRPAERDPAQRPQPARDPSLLAEGVRRFVGYPGGHNEGYPDTFKQCFRAFYDHVWAGDLAARPAFPTFEDGHEEIRLCEAILESHRTQRWVTL